MLVHRVTNVEVFKANIEVLAEDQTEEVGTLEVEVEEEIQAINLFAMSFYSWAYSRSLLTRVRSKFCSQTATKSAPSSSIQSWPQHCPSSFCLFF